MPKIRELISEEKVNQRIAEMGEQISKDYEGMRFIWLQY